MINFTTEFDTEYINCGKINLDWDRVDADLRYYDNEQTKNLTIMDSSKKNVPDNIPESNKTLSYKVIDERDTNLRKVGWSEHNTKSWKNINNSPFVFLWEKQMASQLPLDCPQVMILRQDPGQSLPWHADNLNILKFQYPADKRPVYRITIFLENWKLGHFFQVGTSILTKWEQGDVIVWQPKQYHLSTNAGMKPKWTANVTGFVKL